MDKKEIIISTAMKLFAQKGFEGTSVREIASGADVNPAMISYYFGSKEKLFENLVEDKAGFLKGVFAELVIIIHCRRSKNSTWLLIAISTGCSKARNFITCCTGSFPWIAGHK